MSKILDIILGLLKIAPVVVAYFAGKGKEEKDQLEANYESALRAKRVSEETKDMSDVELDALVRKKVKTKK